MSLGAAMLGEGQREVLAGGGARTGVGDKIASEKDKRAASENAIWRRGRRECGVTWRCHGVPAPESVKPESETARSASGVGLAANWGVVSAMCCTVSQSDDVLHKQSDGAGD